MLFGLSTKPGVVGAALAGFLWLGLVPGGAGAAWPARVDLRGRQTPLQHQGSRGTCSKFATVAALEAAYRRAGYKNLKLSEEFAAYMEKMFWLNAKPVASASATENQAAAWGGGNEPQILRSWTRGMAVPQASDWPYRPGGYTLPANVDWNNQYNVSTFNLDPRHLAASALKAPRFYSVKSYGIIRHPKKPSSFEKVLAGGREVVAAFAMAGSRPPNGVWKYTGPAGPNCEYHAVLIVGYNRPKQYFIVKNSWGPTQTPGAKGYTYVDYKFLKNYCYRGVYIQKVNPPRRWPALRFLGRWLLSFDGHQGILDIYHIPGIMKWHFEEEKQRRLQDRRLGTFYANGDPRKPCRVNGRIQGNTIVFWMDAARPNLRADQLRGRKFTYHFGRGDTNFLAGFHRDPDGRVWGGYACKLTTPQAFTYGRASFQPGAWPELSFLRPDRAAPKPAGPASLPGKWAFRFGRKTGTLTFGQLDSSAKEGAGRTRGVIVPGRLSWNDGQAVAVTARVDRGDPARVEIAGRFGQVPFKIAGKHLSWEKGLLAGNLRTGGKGKGFYGVTLVRRGVQGRRR
jgi:hypothetical protein